jgi:hypothetical protein
LTFSTNAGGNVFSIPKRIPIFLFAIIKTSSNYNFFVSLTTNDQRPTTSP